MAKYGYYVDMHERGSFIADVRDAQGKSIYEVRAGNELGEDESSLIDDGFMRHVEDIDGLQSYMVQLGILKASDRILGMQEFETYLEETDGEERERSRMRAHTTKLVELLTAAKTAQPSKTPVIRNIEGGHWYFMCDGDLVCSPDGVPADYLQVHVCDDVPTSGLGAYELREINDYVDAWLASPKIDSMTPAEEAALAAQEAAMSEAKREHAASRP